jgi:CBS domain-containing protein
MSPQSISAPVLQQPPLLRVDETIETAVRRILDSELPALPAIDDRERYRGIFGEREFMAALFPGYVQQLKHAGFLPRSLDAALEKRQSCRVELVGQHMNTEHVDVGPDFSDTQVAEIFLHHRVLVVPIVDDRRVAGLITRRDFFRALAERFVNQS